MGRILLLLAQLFAVPVTSAYALQSKQDVIVSVTYTDQKPIDVCTYLYALEDREWSQPIDQHCWKPTSAIGDLDVWKGQRLDMVNFKVSVSYPSGAPVDIFLTVKLDT